MRFIPVDNVPAKKTRSREEQVAQKPTRWYIEEFMKMNTRCVKVVFNADDYLNLMSAWTALRSTVKLGSFPIDVYKREDSIYLVRRDLED